MTSEVHGSLVKNERHAEATYVSAFPALQLGWATGGHTDR